jgi:hypothetical protein
MDETTKLLPNETVSINDQYQKKDGKIRLSFLRQLGYGIYSTGQFACVVPFMLVILPARVQYFVSNDDKVSILDLRI